MAIMEAIYSDDRFSVEFIDGEFKYMRECNFSFKGTEKQGDYYEVMEVKYFVSEKEAEHYLKQRLIDWVMSLFNDGHDLETVPSQATVGNNKQAL